MSVLLNDEKRLYERLYERLNVLLGDHQLLSVAGRFGVEALRRSSVLEGFEDFVATKGFTGTRCVEIGTCNGLTAIVLARYFDEVITIDVHQHPLKYEIVDFLGVKNVKFIDAKDNAEKADVLRAMDFDAAYIDGDHAHDTELDFALTRRCGCVLFHEYWAAQPPVQELVDSLRPLGGVESTGKFALWRAS